MSLFEKAVHLTAKYGGVVRTAVKHVVNLVPGGSLVTGTLDQVLESVHDYAKSTEEAKWKKQTEDRLRIGQEEQQNLEQLMDVLLARMDDLMQAAIQWDGLPELENKLDELLQQQPEIRRAFRDIETITQQMEVMRKRIDQLSRGQEEMRPLFERALRFSDSLEELQGEKLTPSLVHWMRQQKDAQEQLLQGRVAVAEDLFAQQYLERPQSVVANMGCAAAQSAGHRFLDAEKSLGLTIQLQGKHPDPQLLELHRKATSYSKGGHTPVARKSTASGEQLKVGAVLGSWQLKRFLARGGLGQVFLATKGTERGALKILHPELTQRPGFDSLFKQEMRALMKLDAHPNLVSIIDFDRDVRTGSQYFVMEFVEGISLEQYVTRKGPMKEEIACRIFLGVADALSKAHARGVFHRDIKPANIMLQQNGRAVLIDWGLAGLEGVAGHSQAVGYTAGFAAPEQLRTGKADAKADVYSLAASLYHVVMFGDVRQRMLFKASAAPAKVRELLGRAFDIDPGERPTAEGFHKHLQASVSTKKPGILDIPEQIGLVDSTPATTPTLAKENTSLSLRCPYCAKENKLPANSKGKSVFCQSCGGAIKVLADGQAVVAKEETKASSKPEIKEPLRPQSNRADEDDDEYRTKKKRQDQEEARQLETSLSRKRRRTKRAKGSFWPAIGIGAGIGVCALVAMFVIAANRKSAPSGKQDDSSSTTPSGQAKSSTVTNPKQSLPANVKPRTIVNPNEQPPAEVASKTLPSLRFKLISAKGKSFMMGSSKAEFDSWVKAYMGGNFQNWIQEQEWRVDMPHDYYIGIYTVTQGEYQKVMGRNPSRFIGERNSENYPVESVTWYDCAEFCNKLSQNDGMSPRYELSEIKRNADQFIDAATVSMLSDGTGYRLPLEWEWEYACRAGTTTRFFFGDDDAVLGDYAWYVKNSGINKVHPVGSRKENGFGLFDMIGNVWQWCEDLNGVYPLTSAELQVGRQRTGTNRVIRGGASWEPARALRSANRAGEPPTWRTEGIGFRIAVPLR